jgi:hypothetical protein
MHMCSLLAVSVQTGEKNRGQDASHANALLIMEGSPLHNCIMALDGNILLSLFVSRVGWPIRSTGGAELVTGKSGGTMETKDKDPEE